MDLLGTSPHKEEKWAEFERGISLTQLCPDFCHHLGAWDMKLSPVLSIYKKKLVFMDIFIHSSIYLFLNIY